MIEINLIPDVKRELLKAQQIRARVIAGSVVLGVTSIVVVIGLSLYVFGYQSSRSNQADKEIIKNSSQYDSKLPEFNKDLSKILTIQNQLTKISEINNNKNIYSRIFDVLGAIIPAENDTNFIQVSNLTIDSESGSIVIDGQAKNSYAAGDVFRKTIEGAVVKYDDAENNPQQVDLANNISIGNVSYGQDATGEKVLRFTITFEYAKELFSTSSKNVAIAITINGNATDSYLGIPKSIFTDRATDLPITSGGGQ